MPWHSKNFTARRKSGSRARPSRRKGLRRRRGAWRRRSRRARFPAARVAVDAGGVAATRRRLALDAAGDALARAAVDARELLDVDVNQLARPGTLVAPRARGRGGRACPA